MTELVDVPSVRLLWLLLPLISVMAALLVEIEVKVEADGSAEWGGWRYLLWFARLWRRLWWRLPVGVGIGTGRGGTGGGEDGSSEDGERHIGGRVQGPLPLLLG